MPPKPEVEEAPIDWVTELNQLMTKFDPEKFDELVLCSQVWKWCPCGAATAKNGNHLTSVNAHDEAGVEGGMLFWFAMSAASDAYYGTPSNTEEMVAQLELAIHIANNIDEMFKKAA